MVRQATHLDAEQLHALNVEFNGEGESTAEHIRDFLISNPQEIVIVDETQGILTGFVCIQLKRSICYHDLTPEITEVYVRPDYRKQGIAGRMIAYAEQLCCAKYPLHKFELLTGEDNFPAQALYHKLGYSADHELHLSKRLS